MSTSKYSEKRDRIINRKAKVLVCGTGSSINQLTDDEIKSYDITIGCNYITKRFIPDFLCVSDIVEYFEGLGGWLPFTKLNTIWVFPRQLEYGFHHIPSTTKTLFITPPKRVYNTLFDLAIPLAYEFSYDIDICGVGGKGHFYDDPDTYVGPRPSMNTYKEVFELYKEYKDININVLHPVE